MICEDVPIEANAVARRLDREECRSPATLIVKRIV